MNQNIITFQPRPMSVLERINQKETVYLVIDCELLPMFGTPSHAQALKYCRLNEGCTISEYPPKTYTEPTI